jgi:undecaprenyl phosphate N,N'-diacetylbacillosamine 1-phosphate transferase
VPRYRSGTFAPNLIPTHARRFTGFDDKIIAVLARGMTVREIQGFLAGQYGTQVSPEFISSVTDEVTVWQQRRLERLYPVIFFGALRVKIHDDAVVQNMALYVAQGVLPDGTRGVRDILIAVVDGLTGLTDAIEAALPMTTVQTCLVHSANLRHSRLPGGVVIISLIVVIPRDWCDRLFFDEGEGDRARGLARYSATFAHQRSSVRVPARPLFCRASRETSRYPLLDATPWPWMRPCPDCRRRGLGAPHGAQPDQTEHAAAHDLARDPAFQRDAGDHREAQLSVRGPLAMPRVYRRIGKRAFDAAVSALALLLVAPVLLVAAVFIRLESKGPVFFMQERIGRDGRPFVLYKLRSMHVEVPKRFVEVQADDPAVTRVGRWLRRTKFDEVPQLLNVLLGDMSFVGPRPMVAAVASQLSDEAHERLSVRPGLTGLAQVNGNIHLTWPERWVLDVAYVRGLSPALDARILLKTVLVVVVGEEKFRRPLPGPPGSSAA